MSFNYYYSNYVIPTLIEANKDFFVKTILPNPNNMQIFIENEAFKFAIKNYTGDTVKPKIKNITANTINEYFIVYVEFNDDFVLEDADNFAMAIAITKEKVRFFTYEKGTDLMTKEDTFFVGENKRENGDSSHLNYGQTSEYKISLLAGRIEEVLNSEKENKNEN